MIIIDHPQTTGILNPWCSKYGLRCLKPQNQPHVQSEKVFGAMNGKSIFAYTTIYLLKIYSFFLQ
jgi:hypothetical protein